jgi:hypothetical protein
VKILTAFEGALQEESSLDVHAAACEGMAKLMLSGVVTDENVRLFERKLDMLTYFLAGTCPSCWSIP